MKKFGQWMIVAVAAIIPSVLFAAPFSPQNTYKDPAYDGNAREVTALGTNA
jgi:hypothetical protein